jgi:hypothetical protein
MVLVIICEYVYFVIILKNVLEGLIFYTIFCNLLFLKKSVYFGNILILLYPNSVTKQEKRLPVPVIDTFSNLH